MSITAIVAAFGGLTVAVLAILNDYRLSGYGRAAMVLLGVIIVTVSVYLAPSL